VVMNVLCRPGLFTVVRRWIVDQLPGQHGLSWVLCAQLSPRPPFCPKLEQREPGPFLSAIATRYDLAARLSYLIVWRAQTYYSLGEYYIPLGTEATVGRVVMISNMITVACN